MKINEVLSEGSYPTDSLSYGSGKDIYVKTLVSQINDYIESSRKAGQRIKMMDFVESYLTKYNWVATPAQKKMLQDICLELETEYNAALNQEKTDSGSAGEKAFGQMTNQLAKPEAGSQAFSQMSNQLSAQPVAEGFKDMVRSVGNYALHKAGSFVSKLGLGSVVKLANAMYMVGQQQKNSPRTTQSMSNMQGTVDNPVLSKTSDQILATMKNMKGENYKDDLESIVRLALNNLYKTDPGDYSQEVKRIMGQKPAQNTQNPQV